MRTSSLFALIALAVGAGSARADEGETSLGLSIGSSFARRSLALGTATQPEPSVGLFVGHDLSHSLTLFSQLTVQGRSALVIEGAKRLSMDTTELDGRASLVGLSALGGARVTFDDGPSLRTRPYASLGAGLSLVRTSELSFYLPGQKILVGTSPATCSISPMLSLALGVTRRLTDRLAIDLEASGSVSLDATSAGLDLRIRWHRWDL